MQKISNISILLSFLGLWLTSFLKNENQLIVGFLLILTFGIIHGANDLLLIESINKAKTQSYKKTLIHYIVVVLVAVLLFSFIPWLALLLFIVVSSYHFGEQHWEKMDIYSNKIAKIAFHSIYGLFILFLLFNFHDQEVLSVVYDITGIDFNYIDISLCLKSIGVLLLGMFIYNYFNSIVFKKNILIELLYLLVFTIIFKVGTLIWAFTIYFIFWHSIPSLADQVKFLYGTVSLSNFKVYIKSAFLYWMISIIGIVILYILLKDYKIFDSIFFSFLAAITFPHVIVIERMFAKQNEKTE